jgi:ATP-binding cassette subfamily B protein
MADGYTGTFVERFSEELRAARERITYLRRAFRLITEAAGGWTLLWAVLLVLQGLLPAASVYLTKVVIDAFTGAVGQGLAWETVRPVLLPALLMGGVLLLRQVSGSILTWIRTGQAEHIQDHIKTKIHRKAARVDLAFYEVPELADRMARANGEAGSRSLSLLQTTGGLIQNSVTLVAVGGLLVPYGLWVPIVLLISTLPAFWVVLRHNLLHHAWWEQTTEDRRWAQYYDRMQTFRHTAPEIRSLGLSDHFRSAYNSLRQGLRDGKLELFRKKSLAQVGAGLAALTVMVAVVGWMGIRALTGSATLGDVALFYQAFSRGQGLMRSLLSNIGQLYTDTRFLEHLFDFLDLRRTIESPADPRPVPPEIRRGIVFEDVTFSYPGSEENALDRFNLFIPARETVAIVGSNGAGKSTIIKLLCRFYDPQGGTVKLDGIDIRSFDLEEFRRQFTVMFQYPVRYVASVAENVRMGDIEADQNSRRMKKAVYGGGARHIVERLPDGYDTLLGKQFSGGVELSGGQWQRIMLARAFYREAPVVVLDEPTSFMDSWTEMQWRDRFYDLVEDRTAIIVTHRFTTAMRADKIHVMDNGKIVESGSHETLLQRGGLYAASWKAQMNVEESTVSISGLQSL